MTDMPEWQRQCFDHFMRHYKQNWDLNQYYRDGHDEDLEYYLGYRDQTKYPLAYSISFNKLLPRVMQVMSRFMDQLYQPNSNELVGVRPRKRSDVDRVQRVQGLLNFQLETLNDIDTIGGSYYFNFQWMLNAVAFGKGVAKLVWRKEERIGPTRIQIPVPKMDRAGNVMGLDMKDLLVEMPQVIYDGPYAEVIHNKNFLPHPHYRDIQKMPAVFCVYKRSIDYLKQMADKGVYGNIQNLGWGSSGAGSDTYEAIAKSLDIEGAITSQQLESGKITPEVDVIEGYGRYIFPEDEIPYEVGSGMVIKGKESEAIVHIGNYKTVLQIQKNKYGVRPFFDIGAYMHPELYWDLGLIKLGKEIQEQYNNLGNLRFQNAMMSVNQMLKVRQDADIDPRALIWKPFGIIPVEDMNDVEPMQTLDIASSGTFREQSQFFEDVLSDMTGMYQYGLGGTPPRQEHVGTIYSLQQVGEARVRLMLMTMDYQGFRPFLKHMMLLNTYHLDPEFEARIMDRQGPTFEPLFPGDLHPDYDFTVRYTAMEPALGKQFRAQQLIQYAQMWQATPYLQQYEFMKAILEMMDFQDSDRYLKSPEQIQQEQVQQAQMMQEQQMQAMMAQMQMQDTLATKQHERKVQGDLLLEQTKQQGEVVKELMK